MRTFYRNIQFATFGTGLLSVLLPILFWKRIPDTIPSHYNAAGIPDAYSDKSMLILIFFAVLMLMGVMGIASYSVKAAATSQHAKEAEKSMLHTVYPALLVMNLMVQLMFAYIIFCCVTCRKLGGAFLWIALTAVLLPVTSILILQWRTAKAKPDVNALYKEAEGRETGIVYRSKVDWWLAILLGGTTIWMIWLTIEPILNGNRVSWMMMGTTIFVLLILAPLFKIRYVFYADHLLVSCGTYGKDRIAYDSIRSVKETKNPLSSAALSLVRIQIDCVRNGVHQMVLISPVRKQEILKQLKQKSKTGYME